MKSAKSKRRRKFRASAQLKGRRQATESRAPEQKSRSWALFEFPQEEPTAGPQHSGDLPEAREQRLVIEVLQHMGREDDIERPVVEGQASGRRDLQPNAILHRRPCDFMLADADQLRRDVNADRR